MRILTRAIKEAGGEVSWTTKGHLRVKGPTGLAFLQSDLRGPNAVRGVLAELRLRAGIDLVGLPL